MTSSVGYCAHTFRVNDADRWHDRASMGLEGSMPGPSEDLPGYDPNDPIVLLRRNRREALIVRWRALGLTYREIGRRLGISASRAMQLDWRRRKRRSKIRGD